MIKENLRNFRQFLLRGNVVDLAVAVVVGAAFNAVVQGFVRDIITPLISAIGGQPNFASLTFHLRHSTFAYGDFLNVLISFIIEAAVVYFFVVLPINRLVNMMYTKPTDSPTTRLCPECLSEVPVKALRCKFCSTRLKQPTPSDSAAA